MERSEELTVQAGVRVQAAASIARTSSGSIGESTAGFLDEQHPRRVIPDVAALGHEGVDLAANELDEREGARGARAALGGRRALDSSSRASITASASVAVVLTRSRRVVPSSRGHDDSKEPPPRVAHQQRRSAGAVTTATSMVPRTSSATWIRQFGSPDWKNEVPSIGSRIQTRSDAPSRPSSSPRNASSGRASDNVSRSRRSTARSASVTGVPSAFSVADTPVAK